jgi:hypothetical protein
LITIEPVGASLVVATVGPSAVAPVPADGGTAPGSAGSRTELFSSPFEWDDDSGAEPSEVSRSGVGGAVSDGVPETGGATVSEGAPVTGGGGGSETGSAAGGGGGGSGAGS